MSWVTGAPVWLAPGASIQWWYGWGDDHGVQTAAANPHTPDSFLVAYDQAQQKASGGAVTYFVTIRNNGPQWAYHNIRGGGVT